MSRLELARLDQRYALAPLCRPLRRGPRPALKVSYQLGSGTVLTVVGPEALGIDDQDVLVALVRLSTGGGRDDVLTLPVKPVTAAGQAAREDLWAEGVEAVRDSTLIRTSLHEIARLVGISTGGRGLAQIDRSLWRLGTTTARLDVPGHGWGTARLIGMARRDEEGRVAVALNPSLALATLTGSCTYIDMAAYRMLRGDIARRLLLRLSAMVAPGQRRRLRVDGLAETVWGDPSEGDVRRQRRRRVRGALGEIDALAEWAVADSDGMADISRAVPGSP